MERCETREPRAAEFFDALFDESDILEVRRFPSKRQDWIAAPYAAMVAAASTEDVYFGANPRTRKGGSTAQEVALARCVFVDFDHVADPKHAEELIRNADLPAPTCVVQSGRGVHAYWRLDEPLTDMVRWNAVQRGLIEALGTDKAIHDPPRIMRMPGSVNTKNGVTARVFVIRDAVYPIDEFPEASRRETPAPTGFPPVKSPDRLSRRTLLFLHAGAQEGSRNAELFAAACDMAGNGYLLSEIESQLIPAAQRCGLDADEAAAAIKSAVGKSRVPAKPETVTPEMLYGEMPTARARTEDDSREQRMTADDSGAQSAEKDSSPTPPLSNVFESFEEVQTKKKDGTSSAKVERRLIYKSAPLLAAELMAVTNRWPKLVGDRPFIMVGEGLNQKPHLFKGAPDLFGWLHSKAGMFWTERACYDRESKGERSALGKAEFYEFLRMSSDVERYTSVSVFPHHPPLRGLYYPPIDLPEPTGEALEEFVAKLNPETEDDRRLLTALILTPGAGLAPGTRPLFVITSENGQGAGKTSTARAISDIWGGSCDLDFTEDWASLAKRIMSSDDAFARVMMFDNVKGSVFGSGTLEAAITAKTITGWKSYVGQVSRPNDATFVVTFNDPALTRDLTDRAVVIKIGQQRHQFDFVTWASEFVHNNRAQLLADCLGMLRGEPLWDTGQEVDRFQAWQHAVLTRVPGGERLGSLIVGRRADVDADYDSAACLYMALADHCKATGTDEITGVELRGLMIDAGLWADDVRHSPSQNKANATKLAKRTLSGRRVLESAKEADGSVKYRVTFDSDTRTRTAVYRVRLANSGQRRQAEQPQADADIPI